ncbi:MAG: methionine ABC transporter ATP-binding protein [Deltaproteobacteria bacterium]|jgi:D-methionine transport system ATP-binding protein|nr:methionine ABC transporter ATP-binding protein [Deltaproteobacteria bacterium]
MPLIEIKGLRKIFGNGMGAVEALRGVDLEVAEGEIFGVVGLSGAGKSTLVRCINLLERPDAGTVSVAGRDMTSLSGRELRLARRSMGMIFQSFNLLSSRTAAGNVSFPLEAAGADRVAVRTRVQELLDLVGLSDKAGSYPSQLSGGQKQRVGIARALANDPRILLCDEATSALDPQTTASILALISDIQRRLGLTVVIITHEMKVITEICDRVAVMEDGSVVEEGPVAEVFTRPRHPVTRGFVETVLKSESGLLESGYAPKGRLLRVRMTGDAVQSPITGDVARLFGVSPVILQAHVDRIKETPFGSLLLDLQGPPDKVEQASAWLAERSGTMLVETLN